MSNLFDFDYEENTKKYTKIGIFEIDKKIRVNTLARKTNQLTSVVVEYNWINLN